MICLIMDDLREFFHAPGYELKRTDVISGRNPRLDGPGRTEPSAAEWSRQKDWRGG